MTEKKPAPPVVAICIPMYGRPSSQFWRSYKNLAKPSSASELFGRAGATHTIDITSHPIVMARNMLTEEALKNCDPPATHVLMVDDDMEFPAHALHRLVSHDLPVVGGLCHNRRIPYAPIIMRRQKDRDSLGFMYSYPRGKVVECDATGAGFLLIKREVFEAISECCSDAGTAQDGGWWNQRRALSEDFAFCERAKECGFSIHVDTGLEIGHVAEVVIYSTTAEKLRPFQLDRWNPEPEINREPGAAPIASVIIPTFNQDLKHLRAAVFSAARQTVPTEVIVVDDGSDPPVPFEGWPENVHVSRHVKNGWVDVRGIQSQGGEGVPENRGIAAALNTGIKSMNTDWFCWLSSDDLYDPRKVEMQLATLRAAGPSAKLSFHRYQVFDGTESLALFSQMPNWSTVEEQMNVLARTCAINGSTVMIHKSVFEEVGLFNPEYRYAQDWEFWCRAGEKHIWYGIGEILGSRRERAGNLTQQLAEADRQDARKLRRDAEDRVITDRYAHWRRGG
jgi:teichuronic acid biosynthesis glycosyltransferase TuaG